MDNDYELNAKRFKALCDSNRLYILDILKAGEHCACKLLELLNVGQSTLSHHMKILVDANIVKARKEGKWSHYSLNDEGIKSLITYIENMSSNK